MTYNQCRVSKSILAGTVRCPPSKSYTHRAIFMAALAESGGTTITNILRSADTDATIDACRNLGAKIKTEADAGSQDAPSVTITVTKVIQIPQKRDTGIGSAGRIPDGDNDTDGASQDFGTGIRPAHDNGGSANGPHAQLGGAVTIDAANSGTTIRIAAGVAALLDIPVTLTGDSSLKKRPMQPLLDALGTLGALQHASDSGHPPLVVQGPITGGSITIPGDISSQFLTSLFLCAPKTAAGIEVCISGNMVSKPYLDATIQVMREFGVSVQTQIPYKRYSIRPQQVSRVPVFAVPSDASSLALLLAASALNGGGVAIEAHMGTLPQGDEVFIEMLESMGASIFISDNAAGTTGTSAKMSAQGSKNTTTGMDGTNTAFNSDGTQGRAQPHTEIIRMNASQKRLRGGRFDLGNHPDLLPPLAITALECDGPIEIFNVQHARLKETDRIAILARELPKLGMSVDEKDDGMILCCTSKSSEDKTRANHGDSMDGTPVMLDSGNDHRLFMALCIGAMHTGRYDISHPESASVSYPGFIHDMTRLGAIISIK